MTTTLTILSLNQGPKWCEQPQRNPSPRVVSAPTKVGLRLLMSTHYDLALTGARLQAEECWIADKPGRA
jgi:hypothetical protein